MDVLSPIPILQQLIQGSMKSFFLISRRIFVFFFLGVILFLFFGKSLTSDLVYRYYFSYFFQGLRVLWDYTLGWSPVPWLYLFLFGVVLWIILRIKQFSAYSFEAGYLFFWKRLIMKLLRSISIVLVLFFILWGFNYKRAKLFQELPAEMISVDSVELMNEILSVSSILNQLRNQISSDSLSVDTLPDFQLLEQKVRSELKKLLTTWKVPDYGRVRIRKIRPEGTLLVWSAAGIYIPFVMEGHIDSGLHPLQWPFVTAHEMAHGNGYTDEGDCNFVGFLTCVNSDDLFFRYSGWLGYYKYLYHDMRKTDKDLAVKLFMQLSKGVRADLQAVSEYSARFPDWLPWWQELVYDNYLKIQGVKEGIRSYNLIVRQVISWKKSGKLPLIRQ